MKIPGRSRRDSQDAEWPSDAAPIELLSNVQLFENVEAKDLATIARSFRERTFQPGDVIAEEGKSGVGFFIIESGTARATHGDIEIAQLGPGSSFGEVALIDEGPRSATVVAETELRCWALTAWEFRPLAETNATVAWNLAKIVARYVRFAAAELDKGA